MGDDGRNTDDNSNSNNNNNTNHNNYNNYTTTIPLFLFDCVSFLTAILPGLCVFSDRNPAMEYTEKLPVEIDPEMWFTRGWNWQKCMDR